MKHNINIQKLGVILEPTSISFEKKAVLNPAVYQDGNTVHVYYRAVNNSFKSCIGYARLEGPTKVVERWTKPILRRKYKYEKNGVEDPRIVKIGETLYMTYVAHDGKNAITALATAKDPLNFKKEGIISPLLTYDNAANFFRELKLKDRYFMFEAFYEEMSGKDVLLWYKDLFLFPKKINGNFALLQRILPDIQLKKKEFWEKNLGKLNEQVVIENKYWFESRNIGGGAPPVYTKDGWLVIYHGVEELNKARVYHACAALLDPQDPLKVIGRLDAPLFSPEESWEKKGMVDNVVFPTGTSIFGDMLYIYYGAADTSIAVATVNINELVETLKKNNP
jgi:beta-1,2-mannobiose phosphorylase / 1,2-beta-oligomannan phosphorylase